MFATTTLRISAPRPLHFAIIAGLACAFVIGNHLPMARDIVAAMIEPFCMTATPAGSSQDVVEPITSHALPNVPGKRVTVVRVFYGPGGFTPPHTHSGSVTAYITRGEIRSQLGGGPVETSRSASPSSSRRARSTWSRRMPATPSPRN